MTWHRGLLVDARRRVRGPVLMPLLAGNGLLLTTAVLALAIPESHAWQVFLSLLLTLGLLSGFVLWNATTLRRLRATTSPTQLWRGALVLGGWLLLAALLFHLIGLCAASVDVRAGYWNSQMSPEVRHLLPYLRLIALQQFAIQAAHWVLVPAMLLPVAMETVTLGLRRSALIRGARVLVSTQHWAVALLGLGIPAMLVPMLVAWHPAHSVTGETVSAVLRLGAALLLTVAGAVMLLSVDAELLYRSSAEQRPSFTLQAKPS